MLYIWIILAVVVIAVVCVCGVFFILSKKKKEGFKASGKANGKAKPTVIAGGAFAAGWLLTDADLKPLKKLENIDTRDQKPPFFVSFKIGNSLYTYYDKKLYHKGIYTQSPQPRDSRDSGIVPILPKILTKTNVEVRVLDGIEVDLITDLYPSDPLELTGRKLKGTAKPAAYNVFKIPASKIGDIKNMTIKTFD